MKATEQTAANPAHKQQQARTCKHAPCLMSHSGGPPKDRRTQGNPPTHIYTALSQSRPSKQKTPVGQGTHTRTCGRHQTTRLQRAAPQQLLQLSNTTAQLDKHNMWLHTLLLPQPPPPRSDTRAHASALAHTPLPAHIILIPARPEISTCSELSVCMLVCCSARAKASGSASGFSCRFVGPQKSLTKVPKQ